MFQFIRQHKALSLAFIAAVLLTSVFLIRLTVSTVLWSDPARLDQPISGWMTPRYVARSWQVPPDVVIDALGLDVDGTARRSTLDQIADTQDRDFEALAQQMETAIDAFRATSDE